MKSRLFLPSVHGRLREDQRRWTEVREEIVERKRQRVDDAEVIPTGIFADNTSLPVYSANSLP